MRQYGNILAAITQAGNMYVGSRSGWYQSSTELAFGDQPFQILVGRGNDADIHLDRHTPTTR